MVLLNMAWMKNSNYVINIGILSEMLAISSVIGFILKLHKSAACSSRLTLSSLPVNVVSIPKPATVAQRKRYTDCPGLNQRPIPEVQPVSNTWIAQEGDSTLESGSMVIRGRLGMSWVMEIADIQLIPVLLLMSPSIPLLQFSSATQSCLTLCDPMNCSTPGLPVHHQLPESTQTHVHGVSDAIQLSHPLSSPSPPALNLSQHQPIFQWVSSLHQVAKVLEFQLQHQSFQWTPRTDLL